jgi:hypothetical protein
MNVFLMVYTFIGILTSELTLHDYLENTSYIEKHAEMGDIYSTHTGHEKLVQNFGHET